MSKKALTLSIVIPVYNEQDYLKACLDSIATQTIKPLDVIVIDNNSTDKSVEIAASYGFVRVLHEKRQGQVFAQAAGFDVAKGDILGRIDADSILPQDWTQQMVEAFAESPDRVAVTGGAAPYDVGNAWIATHIFYFYHEYFAGLFWRHRLLWGSNCAFRAKQWRFVKANMTFSAGIWEDYEMSHWLVQQGEIVFLPHLKVGCSFRAVHRSFMQQIRYQFRNVSTYRLHHRLFASVVYAIAWYSMIALFPFAMLDGYLSKRKTIAHH